MIPKRVYRMLPRWSGTSSQSEVAADLLGNSFGYGFVHFETEEAHLLFDYVPADGYLLVEGSIMVCTIPDFETRHWRNADSIR